MLVPVLKFKREDERIDQFVRILTATDNTTSTEEQEEEQKREIGVDSLNKNNNKMC